MKAAAKRLMPILVLGLGLSACVATGDSYPYAGYGYGYANPDGTTGVAPGHGGYGYGYNYGYGHGHTYPSRPPGVVFPRTHDGPRHAQQQRWNYERARQYCKVQTNSSFKGKKGYTEKQVDRVYGKCMDRFGY
ncbi:MAG: hypothetical protein KIT81_15300 [Alphaproteobacteria bacterium]|nr:hypothetical protein [Alphaproteobacteria bacterium]